MMLVRFLNLCRQGSVAALAYWLCACRPVFAQLVDETRPAEKSYALAYLLVVLFIFFGLLLVLRSSGREREFRAPGS